MNTFSLDDRALGWHLGLGDLGDIPTVCHGYEHGCDCAGCKARARRVSPDFLAWLDLGPDDESAPPELFDGSRQPWEPTARRAA